MAQGDCFDLNGGMLVAVTWSATVTTGLRLSQIHEADELLTRTPKGSLASLPIVWGPRTRWRC